MRTWRRKWVPIMAYVCCILYITILSRTPSLAHVVRPVPLWSYIDWMKGNWTSGKSILLNIALFVPLGYLSEGPKKVKWLPFVFFLLLAGTIELVQFITYRGFFDIDDVISNFIGGAIGVICHRCFCDRLKRLPVSSFLIIIGVIGCILESGSTQIYETQFDFQIQSVEVQDSAITLRGTCDIYRRGFLPYQIQLKGEDSTIHATTTTDGTQFTAIADTLGVQYEVDVLFQGYQPINTRTYLNSEQVEYVPNAPTPDLTGTDLEFLLDTGVLKEYNDDYDVYVYQVDNRLYWLIGADFDASIIYHLYTEEKENLPEERLQYGFDNRGFRIGSEKELTETMNCGSYRAFTDIIPSEYSVTAIAVGMNRGSDVFWREYFRPNK